MRRNEGLNLLSALAIFMVATGWLIGEGHCQEMERYVRKDIIIIPWGDEKGEFGYPTAKRKGVPRAWLGGFDIDEREHVYIADSGNVRVLKYTTDGKFVQEVDLGNYVDGIGWLAVDAHDNIYVVDDTVLREAYLVVVDGEGKLLKNLPGIHFVRSDCHKNIVVGRWDSKGPAAILYHVHADSFTHIDFPATTLTEFSESQDSYYHVIDSTPTSTICTYDREGRVLDKITTRVPVGGIAGIDESGNFYCPALLSPRSEPDHEVDIVKVDHDGNILAVVELWRFAVEYKVKIDNEGNIYLMSHRQCPWQEEERKKGFRLIKYEPVKSK